MLANFLSLSNYLITFLKQHTVHGYLPDLMHLLLFSTDERTSMHLVA